MTTDHPAIAEAAKKCVAYCDHAGQEHVFASIIAAAVERVLDDEKSKAYNAMTTPSERALATWLKALDAYCDSTCDDVPLGENDQAGAQLIDSHCAAETRELREACEDALQTLRAAVRCGLSGFSEKKINEIVENHSTITKLKNAHQRVESATPESKSAEYVKYTDYAAAIAERDALCAEVERANGELDKAITWKVAGPHAELQRQHAEAVALLRRWGEWLAGSGRNDLVPQQATIDFLTRHDAERQSGETP